VKIRQSSIPTTIFSKTVAEPYLQSFSRDYAIVQNAEVRTWNEEEAHMDADLYYALEDRLGGPVQGLVGGLHYIFKPSTQVLSKQCAIPKRRGEDPSALLVMK